MNPAARPLPHALSHLDRIRERLGGRKLAVFLDYDGTLSPIASTPDAAILPDATREALRQLAGRCPVAIVSGRDRADVAAKVGIDSLIYAGAHGFDIAGGALGERRHCLGREFAPALAEVRSRLRARLEGIDGVLLEAKSASLAVHYRQVSAADIPAVKAAVREAMNGTDGLRLMKGKKILEVQPAIEWDKGRALLWLISALELGADDTLAVYVGDDVTDEDAFRALDGHGIGVRVDGDDGEAEETVADYRLGDTGEVARFLAALADLAA